MVVLLGYGHVYSEDADDGPREVAGGAAGPNAVRIDDIGGDLGGNAAIIVVGDRKLLPLNAGEGDEATELVDEGAVEASDGAGEVVTKVGACDGRRFKKCR